jgi:hypothetical protein
MLRREPTCEGGLGAPGDSGDEEAGCRQARNSVSSAAKSLARVLRQLLPDDAGVAGLLALIWGPSSPGEISNGFA